MITKRNIVFCTILIIICLIVSTIISFKNSYKYCRYEMRLALQKHDSSIIEKYYNFESIVDNAMNQSLQEIGDNPFAGLGVAMFANIRPTLIQNLKINVEKSFENYNEKNIPSLVILYKCFIDKPMTPNDSYKVSKINKNKIIVTSGNLNDPMFGEFTWKRIDKKWQIVEFKTVNNPVYSKLEIK